MVAQRPAREPGLAGGASRTTAEAAEEAEEAKDVVRRTEAESSSEPPRRSRRWLARASTRVARYRWRLAALALTAVVSWLGGAPQVVIEVYVNR